MDDLGFAYFQSKARQLTGIDLRGYKAEQMRRRLRTLMARARVSSFVEYGRALEHDPRLLEEFRHFVTINVSEFFRDGAKFEQLRTSILPVLLNGSRHLRIWSAGCSNGAEPYSVAILLEEMGVKGYWLLATDIDQGALRRAREGRGYQAREIKNLNPQRLARHFTPSEQGYDLSPAIRGRVQFRHHDLLRDPFEGPFDLIVCRNVVIYFTDEAKETVYRKFYHALRPGGVLFVGGTEVILRAKELGFQTQLSSFYVKGKEGGLS